MPEAENQKQTQKDVEPLEPHHHAGEVHPENSRWAWLLVAILVLVASFGVTLFVLKQNEAFVDEIEGGFIAENNRFTSKALQKIGSNMMELKKEAENGKEKVALGYLGKRDIYSQIENWEQYSPAEGPGQDLALENSGETRELLGLYCDNEDLDSLVYPTLANSEMLLISWEGREGVSMLTTPNPTNLSNKEFSELGSNCEGEERPFRPLYAYEDRLLWHGGCSAVDSDLPLEEQQSIVECNETLEVVKDFYRK